MYNVQGKVSCMTFMDPRTLLLAISRGLYGVLYTVFRSIDCIGTSLIHRAYSAWNGQDILQHSFIIIHI